MVPEEAFFSADAPRAMLYFVGHLQEVVQIETDAHGHSFPRTRRRYTSTSGLLCRGVFVSSNFVRIFTPYLCLSISFFQTSKEASKYLSMSANM